MRLNFIFYYRIYMESAALEAIIDKFLDALRSVVKGDSRFDFDE